MDVSEFLGGALLTHVDLPQPTQIWTVRAVDKQLVGKDKEPKVCVHFNEHQKPLGLNKTNLSRLVSIPFNLGTNANAWMGRQMQTYRCWTKYAGKDVLCIRLWLPEQPPPEPIVDVQGNPAQAAISPPQATSDAAVPPQLQQTHASSQTSVSPTAPVPEQQSTPQPAPQAPPDQSSPWSA